MSDPSVFRFILLSALIGFAVFSLSYTLLVWRRRNNSVSGRTAGDNLLARLRGWSVTLAMLGLIGMAVGFAVREAISAEGSVSTEGLFTARVRDDARVDTLAPEGDIKAGDLLVKYRSSQVSAELEEAELRMKRLEAEQKSLPLQPLPYDPELVRHHQNAAAEKREVQATLDNVLTAHETAIRDLVQQVLSKQETLTKVDGDFVVTENEIRQAQNRRDIAINQLARESVLSARGIVPATEIDERQKEVKTWEVEVSKLQGRFRNIEAQRKQLNEMLGKLNNLTTDQTTLLQKELDRMRVSVQKADQICTDYLAKLKTDEERAQKLRDNQIEQLNLKIQETKAVIKGLDRRLEVRAPFAGKVFYRHPSPGAAANNTPLVVLGPDDGFRLKMRLPTRQVAALTQTEEFMLDVGEGQLNRKFPAKFRQATELPNEPGTTIAELDCSPPADAVKMLAEDARVKARFMWSPPLLAFWPFEAGVITFGVGIVGLVFFWMLGSIIPPPPESAAVAVSNRPKSVPFQQYVDPVSAQLGMPVALPLQQTPMQPLPFADQVVESEPTIENPDATRIVPRVPVVASIGDAGEVIEVIASQLREAIRHEKLEEDVVASAEWALDKHYTRSVRELRRVFREDGSYVPHLQTMLARMDDPFLNYDGENARQRELTARLSRILDLIGARFLSVQPV